jgi:D-arabinitol dehydrogenase (NADP+)
VTLSHHMLISQPRKFDIRDVPVPKIGDDELLLKGTSINPPIVNLLTSLVDICGVCGTDAHIHEGEFIAKFPVCFPSNP